MELMKNYTHSSSDEKIYIYYITYTLGWICTTAWLLSFCPQIYINWKRTSVVGLSLDFLAFNTVGFLVFSAYVISLLWIPSIKAENEADNSGRSSQVHVPDAVFSLLALFLTVITVVQSIVYDRGGQRVSEWTRITLVVLAIVVVISLIVPATSSSRSSWTWLDSINALSYIKVVVTVLKYWPQVLLNYRRKSTEGWSVHNVLLDFGGGWISMIQMFIDATASGTNNWPSSYQNIAKYWLCVITLIFDSVFLMQHYALYARNQHGYQMLNQRLNGVLETAAAEEDNVGRDERQGHLPRTRAAEWEGLEIERQALIIRGQQRADPNTSRHLPIDHLSRDIGSVGIVNTVEEMPVRVPNDNQRARPSRPPGPNCIHGPGHRCFSARVSSAEDISDDVSINSPTNNIYEPRETENSPVLTRGSGSRYGAINPTGAVDTHSNIREINQRHTVDNTVNPNTLHESARDEIERSRRELQDLGINFS